MHHRDGYVPHSSDGVMLRVMQQTLAGLGYTGGGGVEAVALVAQLRQMFSMSEIRWLLAVVFSICFLSMEVDPCTPCTSVHHSGGRRRRSGQ